MINRLPLDRIKFYVAKLADEKTKSSARFACWRGIISSATDAFEIEVQQMEAANMVHADPGVTALTGEPVV